MLYFIYAPILAFLILLYFRLAKHYNIIDKPNHRSSHRALTIRGAGVIFPLALLIQFFASDFHYQLFTGGLMLISAISFMDDIKPLPNKLRIIIHLISVTLLFLETGLVDYPFWIVLIAYILVIGTINAYNFMDGINGITGAYSLVTIGSFYIINQTLDFVLPEWLLMSIIVLLIFSFFNFRKKAKCFAGDVGSVSMAFIIVFFLLSLILKTSELKYIGLLLVYGLDAVTTILFRLVRRENIFKPHRSHFYQYLANVKGWPHLRVSGLYMLAQLLVNVLIIRSGMNWMEFSLFILASGVVFIGVRFIVEGKKLMDREGLRKGF